MSCFVVFLDIDGVLNTYNHAKNVQVGLGLYLNLQLLKNFIETQKKMQFSIVLSSTWRSLPHARSRIQSIFAKEGIAFIGYTEDLGKKDWQRNRAREILQWVGKNKPCGWIAIDDLPLRLPSKHFVHTDENKGFTIVKQREFITKHANQK